jgi:hypothetical protein
MAVDKDNLCVKGIVFSWFRVVRGFAVMQVSICFDVVLVGLFDVVVVCMCERLGPFGLSSQGDGAMPRTT